MTIDEIIAVLQAYKEGKTIQFAFKEDGKFIYTIPSEGEVAWDFTEYNYRIKPEPHYRPFESEKELIKAIKMHGEWVKYDCGYYRITYFSHDAVQVSNCNVESFTKAFKELTWADGTPFGKLVKD